MRPLTEDIDYQSEADFQKLTSAIQTEIDLGNLQKYIDKTWRKQRTDGWNGEYISLTNRRMYRLTGSHHHSTNGEAHFKGKWTVIRDEQETEQGMVYSSEYQIRAQEPGIYAKLTFEITFLKSEKASIEFHWKDVQHNGKEHSRLIKSSVEFGIISAFEDVNPESGIYKVTIPLLRYHPIDSSFSLLNYAANRTLKRALFVEQEDEHPSIEGRTIARVFRPNFTIVRWNGG